MAMVELFVTLLGVALIFLGSVGLAALVMRLADSCNHSYERIDTCNDKKMILVCRRCGKIKKLRK